MKTFFKNNDSYITTRNFRKEFSFKPKDLASDRNRVASWIKF